MTLTVTRPTAIVDRPVLAGIAAVSAALLMTELSLTRIFSVTMYYHFAFLAISIALFGLSASGVFVFLMRRQARRRRYTRVAFRWCAIARCDHAGRARLPGADPRRPQLLARESGVDAGHLRAGRAAVLHRRCRHLTGLRPPHRSDQRALRRRPARRGGRLPGAHPADEPAWRAWRRDDRGGAVAARCRAVRAAGRRGAASARLSIVAIAIPGAVELAGGAPFAVNDDQGPRVGPRAVQQVEFVLARRGLRPRPRRLVAQPGFHRQPSQSRSSWTSIPPPRRRS